MICPIFLPISHPYEQQIVEKALIERFNFCCEALHPIPFTHLNHGEEYAILHQEPRVRNRRVISYYRQYVHRTLSCFVRMTQTGLVWISNRKLQSDEIQEIFDGLRQLVSSVHIAHSAIADVVERVFETREAVPLVAVGKDEGGAHEEDMDAQSGSDEGGKTETNTTDEDNERVSMTSNNSMLDEDKENVGPAMTAAANLMRSLPPDVDAVPRKDRHESASTTVALTNGSSGSFVALTGGITDPEAADAVASADGKLAPTSNSHLPPVDLSIATPVSPAPLDASTATASDTTTTTTTTAHGTHFP